MNKIKYFSFILLSFVYLQDLDTTNSLDFTYEPLSASDSLEFQENNLFEQLLSLIHI